MEKDPSERLRRAIKENNLFLVKRLLSRTEMRNPDSSAGRYTSLAWAAVCGHEEIFEYLLSCGHDDEELSRDTENNTILIMLADLKAGTLSPYQRPYPNDPDLQETALRMARSYYERYSFLIDWSNVHGKTALHVAALKGNEEFVKMFCDLGADFDLADELGNTPLHYASAWGHIAAVQLLIERGCQYTAKNNEGFTASDYAYSYSTMSTLQDVARIQFENNKLARRQQVFAQAAARAGERRQDWDDDEILTPVATIPKHRWDQPTRLRSGSGGSMTTSASEGNDHDPLTAAGFVPLTRTPARPHQSSLSSNSSQPSNSSSTYSLSNQPTNPARSASFGLLSSIMTGSGTPKSEPVPTKPTPPPLAPAPVPAASALSPIATRVRERDADAITQYIKRTRSGSDSTMAEGASNSTLAPPAPSAPPAAPLPAKAPSTTSRRPSGMLAALLPLSPRNHPIAGEPQPPSRHPARYLRPSISAASLRAKKTDDSSSEPKSREGKGHTRYRSITLDQTPKPAASPLGSSGGEKSDTVKEKKAEGSSLGLSMFGMRSGKS